jgi:hypothetical protein
VVVAGITRITATLTDATRMSMFGLVLVRSVAHQLLQQTDDCMSPKRANTDRALLETLYVGIKLLVSGRIHWQFMLAFLFSST